jgi:D-alanyl-D-alanine carboxypeptidase (penicillin-binding protein 5/6)
MRLPRLLSAALACAVALLMPAATAAAADGSAEPVGGPLLGSRGVVVEPLAGAPALPSGLTAASWLVADLDTGDVLAARDAHAKRLPASTQKILTALTLIPRLDPTAVMHPTNADVDVDGSKVGLVPGTGYTVAQLFTAMLVVSGNDAANALAHAAGGTPATLALMNAEAHRLQADDTVARTPSGLDAPGETTSAYDLALIARAALQLPDFRKYVGTVRSFMPAPGHKHFEIYTHNRLLTTYPGTIGVKNGYTITAGATYVGAATRGGHTLLVSLMRTDPRFWHDAEKLLDWGFKADGHVTPVGRLVDPLPDHPEHRVTPTVARAVPVASRQEHRLSPVTLSLAGLSASITVFVTARRRRRVRRRLRLPPI